MAQSRAGNYRILTISRAAVLSFCVTVREAIDRLIHFYLHRKRDRDRETDSLGDTETDSERQIRSPMNFYAHRKTEKEIETDRQTHRQTDRKTNRQIDRPPIDRPTDRLIHFYLQLRKKTKKTTNTKQKESALQD